jgi:hypothetical protein
MPGAELGAASLVTDRAMQAEQLQHAPPGLRADLIFMAAEIRREGRQRVHVADGHGVGGLSGELFAVRL